MTNKVLWYAVGLLGVACAGQAYHIHSQKKVKDVRPVADDFRREQEKWFSQARENMFKGTPVPFRHFDELFNDEFFGRRFDPFSEIEDFNKKMGHLLPDNQRLLFGQSWKDWFHDRMDVAEIRPEIKTTEKDVTVSFKVPGLEGESLNIDVNNDRIRIGYDAKTVEEKKSDTGVSRSESVRHFEKILPVPEEAKAHTNRIVRDRNVVKIIFEKRPRGKTDA